jgi:hypothetical protein
MRRRKSTWQRHSQIDSNEVKLEHIPSLASRLAAIFCLQFMQLIYLYNVFFKANCNIIFLIVLISPKCPGETFQLNMRFFTTVPVNLSFLYLTVFTTRARKVRSSVYQWPPGKVWLATNYPFGIRELTSGVLTTSVFLFWHRGLPHP